HPGCMGQASDFLAAKVRGEIGDNILELRMGATALEKIEQVVPQSFVLITFHRVFLPFPASHPDIRARHRARPGASAGHPARRQRKSHRFASRGSTSASKSRDVPSPGALFPVELPAECRVSVECGIPLTAPWYARTAESKTLSDRLCIPRQNERAPP